MTGVKTGKVGEAPSVPAGDATPNGETAEGRGEKPRDVEFEAQMTEARRIMRERRSVLRELAK